MHASKRITFLAILFWCGVWALAASANWEVLMESRRGLTILDGLVREADSYSGSPRILLLGSSPIGLGVSAKKIEAETHIATFNLSVFGSTNFFDEYLQTAQAHIRQGDIVVLSDPKWSNPAHGRLPMGCGRDWSMDCTSVEFRLIPHLSSLVHFMLGQEDPYDLGQVRDERGDFDLDHLHLTRYGSVARLAYPPSPISDESGAMEKVIHQIQALGACPLLTLGPVLVKDHDLPIWYRDVGLLDSRLQKRGLHRYVLDTNVIRTDRADFIDSYEHPTAQTGAAWTQRIIDALLSHTGGPCTVLSTSAPEAGDGAL